MNNVLLGILGLLVLMFGVVIGALIHGEFPANAGDWVSFSGAIIGSMVTVAGAIAAFEWQADSARRRRRKMLTDQLDYVIRLCLSIEDPLALPAAAKLNAQIEAAERLRSALVKLRHSLAWAQPDSSASIEAYEIIKALRPDVCLEDPKGYLTSNRPEARDAVPEAVARIHAEAAAARTILDYDV